MREVNVTELRNHLPAYLGAVRGGEQLLITSRGKVVAKLIPSSDPKQESRAFLESLRTKCRVGDVVTSVGDRWEADRDPA